MADVICLGEALIDLVPTKTGLGLAEATTFVKAAGGAPANVATGVARLGGSSAFIGMVGDDGFGRFLVDTLVANGVDTSGIRWTDAAPTALAAVSLQADGERDFIFYGSPAAHMRLTPDDIDEALIAGAAILHFGSISLIADPVRAATLRAIEIARTHDVLVSYDPNLRLPLWPSIDAAREGLRLGLAHAELVKISEDEVAFLTSACDLIEGARALWHPSVRFVAVTRGCRGSIWLDPTSDGAVPGFEVPVIDTTGAGDAFTAGLLAEFVRNPDLFRDRQAINAAVRFANAVGALATTKRGAVPALPDRQTVERFLAGQAETVAPRRFQS